MTSQGVFDKCTHCTVAGLQTEPGCMSTDLQEGCHNRNFLFESIWVCSPP